MTLTISDIRSILQEIFIRTGRDFRNYAYSSIKRRIELIMFNQGCETADDLLARLRKNDLFPEKILSDIYIPATEMFRDPEMWNAMQKQVFPKLSKKQNLKIAVPSCVSGDELFTLMILLQKANLLDNTKVSVSVICKDNLELIENVNYPLKKLDQIKKNLSLLSENLQTDEMFKINGKFFSLADTFSDYIEYTTKDFFRDENAVGFDLILYRNKLIYFSSQLQSQTIEHLTEKLNRGGYLALGIGEDIGIVNKRKLKIVNKTENIFRK